MSAEDSAAVESLIRRYIECFNASDYPAALQCYRLPFTWFFGSRAVSVTTEAEFLETMAKTSAQLREQGLSASTLESVTVRLLGEHLALAGVVVVRREVDGGLIARLGATYLVHKGREGWRLAANGSHPVEAIVPPA